MLTLPVYRFVFMIILGLVFVATDVLILRRFRVNYIFIFELDPNYKITHIQLYRVAMMLLTIFMLFFMVQIFVTKLDYLFDPPTAMAALGLITTLVVLCTLPCHIFYLRARQELVRVLFHIFSSPFGLVKFKHFFFADIMTSFVLPLKDMGSIVCLFASGAWLDLDKNAADIKNTYLNQYQALINYQLAIAFLPFWLRLA